MRHAVKDCNSQVWIQTDYLDPTTAVAMFFESAIVMNSGFAGVQGYDRKLPSTEPGWAAHDPALHVSAPLDSAPHVSAPPSPVTTLKRAARHWTVINFRE